MPLPLVILLLSAFGRGQSDLFDPKLAEQISIQTAANPDPVTPGQPFEVYVEVVPQPGLNVYAPGNPEYVAPLVTFEWPGEVRAGAAVYPSGELFAFGDLKEPVKVYRRRFQIRQRVTIPRDSRTARLSSLDVAGSLRYQACDDRVCFPARTVPLHILVRLSGKATSQNPRPAK